MHECVALMGRDNSRIPTPCILSLVMFLLPPWHAFLQMNLQSSIQKRQVTSIAHLRAQVVTTTDSRHPFERENFCRAAHAFDLLPNVS